ncbi:sensor histidine kinase [Levilactobacillus enshiensis]|uniref:sensor histidine kinase n=1 Tax=Levilactobacillus enshiensis TaxID=2590213 RepID=UPI00131C8426|nr:HAMP domain-containing sensor histidine kinase [Levilactobacillus enshiensis]
MKKSIFNSSAAKITKVYALLLLGITVILSSVIISVVGMKQFQVQRHDALGIVRGLKRSFIANRNDWYWWRLGSWMDTDTTFVRISVAQRGKRQHYLYSPNAKAFLAAKDRQAVTQLTANTRYAAKIGLFYHVRASDLSTNKTDPSVRYDIWVKLNGLMALLWLLIRLILLIALAFLIIGTWFIYLLARKLNQPLVELTGTTKVINEDISNNYERQLPVPDSPQEVHDLTVAFNQLLQSLRDQEQADRRFVSNASHELKTPIATIRGYVSLVDRRGTAHPEVIPTALKYIDQESERMQRLVESLLKLSRANQLELKTTAVDLSVVVQATATHYGESMARAIVTQIQPQVTAQAHQDSVEQILVSLLNNAQKYSPAEAPIVVSLTTNDQAVTLAVADQGMGVPDEQKKLIFGRFYRASSVRNSIAGNGLGLAIVQQLVTLSHGQIEVRDNQPQGSIFVVTLPR